MPALKVRRYVGHLMESTPPEQWPDAIIFDLEDSIPLKSKASARELLSDELPKLCDSLPSRLTLLVKINSIETPQFQDDLSMLKQLNQPRLGIATAKTESLDELQLVHEVVSRHPTARLFPAFETLAGFDRRDELFGWASRHGVTHFAFGGGDMSHSLGIERDYSSQLLGHVFCSLVLSGLRNGVGLIDSPARVLPSSPDFDATLSYECDWAKRNGAKGKLTIHPAQVPTVNRILGRNVELSKEKRVLEEFDDPGRETNALIDPATNEYIGKPSRLLAEKKLQQRNRLTHP